MLQNSFNGFVSPDPNIDRKPYIPTNYKQYLEGIYSLSGVNANSVQINIDFTPSIVSFAAYYLTVSNEVINISGFRNTLYDSVGQPYLRGYAGQRRTFGGGNLILNFDENSSIITIGTNQFSINLAAFSYPPNGNTDPSYLLRWIALK